MIRSMTGFGQASAELAEARVSVELKTVNHRYADMRVRLPTDLISEERTFRTAIQKRVKRGRVECQVHIQPLGNVGSEVRLNRPLLDEVLRAAELLRTEHKLTGEPDVASLLSISSMFRSGPIEVEWNEGELKTLHGTLAEALKALDKDREREGAHLAQDLCARLERMRSLVESIRARAAAQPDAAREKMQARLAALAPEIELDPARLAQEALLLADRCDVTEELVRLAGHLEQAGGLLGKSDDEPLGKRLDFLSQEINRETNTINSKSSDLEMSRLAMEMKAEVEKVREQVQNLE